MASLGPRLETLHLGPDPDHPLFRDGSQPRPEPKATPNLVEQDTGCPVQITPLQPVTVFLPDELVQAIMKSVCKFGPMLARTTLSSCAQVSQQWRRIVCPMMDTSPIIDMGSRAGAHEFLSKMANDLIEYELDLMEFKTNKRPPAHSLIGRMSKLMVVGQAVWRHRASMKSRPALVSRDTLHEILNRLWATQIHTLVLVELPFTNPFFRSVVNRYPSSLSTVIMLTPLTPFELLFFLRELPSLRHLCIGSRDDSVGAPGANQTLFSREQLPSPNLISFGIAARAAERWLKTGLPWLENILNLIVVPCVQTIRTVHLELADDDDERHIMEILGYQPTPTTSEELSLDPLIQNVIPSSALPRRTPSNLENVYLRGISSFLMAHTLSYCRGIRRLCLSSIYGTALRSSSGSIEAQALLPDAPSDLSSDPSVSVDGDPPPLGLLRSRSTPTKNPVWSTIPRSIEELSIEITRLPGHGPWNARSAGQLALTLSELILSDQCPKLIRLGSVFGEEDFQYGIYSHLHGRPILPTVQHLIEIAESRGLSYLSIYLN
ncbi:hypothetical protein CROQUDRAFT_133139 [Cronartium quercuum f. sp. fusiforme G11]|uniref:F-box domain-containing protein n=1 Tax=Cronartium quercuum f. sp. fusiforme G11 TaxID=708437 RepID=A0A9P6NGC2_9BASI|nr:hypothetical protein CROQUDRAFT_133139 [Cronartium quercuum f. sp. fusiforme G11]